MVICLDGEEQGVTPAVAGPSGLLKESWPALPDSIQIVPTRKRRAGRDEPGPASSKKRGSTSTVGAGEEEDGGDFSDGGESLSGASTYSVGSTQSASCAPPLALKKKDGRGRPPTTGQYIGVGKAREALRELRKREAQEQRERELEDIVLEATNARKPPVKRSTSLPDIRDCANELTAAELLDRANKQVQVVFKVARVSQNLQGPMVKALKDSALDVKGIVEEFANRSSSDEVERLQAKNRRLQREVDELRGELMAIRMEMAEMRRAPLSTSALTPISPPRPAKSGVAEGQRGAQRPAPPAERDPQMAAMGEVLSHLREMPAAILKTVGDIMDARFAAIESRLKPEERLRPPLRADEKRRGVAAPSPARGASRAAAQQPPSKHPKKAAEVPPQPSKKGEAASEHKTAEVTWSVVVGRKAKASSASAATTGQKKALPPDGAKTAKPANKAGAAITKKAAGNGAKSSKKGAAPPAANKQKGQGSRAAEVKIRPPRTAAVVLTATGGEGACTLAEAMAEAKLKIKLTDLGIDTVKPRRAVTGALILEIPGQDGAAKADLLAQKMGEALAGRDVKVSRPVKRSELRLTGLDDSVSAQELAQALADEGGVMPTDVKVGIIRRSPNGMGSAWAQVPAAAAKKIAAAGKVKVGWVAARVEALAPRPLQCYRCLGVGHVRQRCTEECDHSDKCYRCGQPGHLAAMCEAAPHCPVCADLGKPAGHRVGKGSCSALSRKKGGAGGAKKTPPAPAKKGAAGAPLPNNAGPSSSPSEVPREDAMEVEA